METNGTTAQISKGYSKLPPTVKTAVTLLALGAGAYILYRIFRVFTPSAMQERQEASNVQDELNRESQISGLSYPKSQYASFANTIEIAGFDVGTDEDAIYSVFYKLKNNADYLALVNAWGSPNRKIYDWGMGYNMTLTQFLRYEMSEGEIQKINAILKAKKIKYSNFGYFDINVEVPSSSI